MYVRDDITINRIMGTDWHFGTFAFFCLRPKKIMKTKKEEIPTINYL
jgi:hypothetical protein